jgi:hypothetical protein
MGIIKCKQLIFFISVKSHHIYSYFKDLVQLSPTYDLGSAANAAFLAFLSVRVLDSSNEERRREEEGTVEPSL